MHAKDKVSANKLSRNFDVDIDVKIGFCVNPLVPTVPQTNIAPNTNIKFHLELHKYSGTNGLIELYAIQCRVNRLIVSVYMSFLCRSHHSS